MLVAEYWTGVGTASLCIFRGLLQILTLNPGDIKEGDFMLQIHRGSTCMYSNTFIAGLVFFINVLFVIIAYVYGSNICTVCKPQGSCNMRGHLCEFCSLQSPLCGLRE